MREKVTLPFLLINYFILYLIHMKISLVEHTDDTWFAEASAHTPFMDWIQMRYTTWSGRLFPDTMLYSLLDEYLWVWKILNPLFFVLLVIGLISIGKKEVTKIDFIIGILVLGYINNIVLNQGFFWITGSINYLWPISFGVIAMIPFANYIFGYGHEFTIKKWIIFFMLGFIASISNEQVALCLSTFSLLSVIILCLKRTVDKRLLFLTLLLIIGTSILIFAPGNKVRWVSEVTTWFPGYQEFTIMNKLHIGVIWIYKQLFFELRNLILLLSCLVFFVYSKERKKLHLVFLIFSVMLFIVISTILLDKQILYNFELIRNYRVTHNLLYFWNSNIGFFISIFPFLFWSIYSLLLGYLYLSVIKNRYFHFFLLAASICTMVVMFFSPTIYASGLRTLVVGSVILTLVIIDLIREYEIFDNRYQIILFGCLPFLNIIQLYISW